MLRLAALLACIALPAAAQDRIASLGGSVSEIVVALGAADRIIARDSTTTFPATLTALPDVGYLRALSPEGVLSVNPDLILAEHGAGPPEAVAALRGAGVPFVTIPDATDAAGVVAKIHAVAHALSLDGAGDTLAATVQADFGRVATLPAVPARRVLFVLTQQNGRLMVAGQDTAADGIIALAGGVNAAQGFTGYKVMTDEAIVTAAPDAVLMMANAGGHTLTDEQLFAHPALAAAPAAAHPVIRLDGLLILGFGPRTPEAALTLREALDDRD